VAVERKKVLEIIGPAALKAGIVSETIRRRYHG